MLKKNARIFYQRKAEKFKNNFEMLLAVFKYPNGRKLVWTNINING